MHRPPSRDPGVVGSRGPIGSPVANDPRIPPHIPSPSSMPKQVRIVRLLPNKNQVRGSHERRNIRAPRSRTGKRIGPNAKPPITIRVVIVPPNLLFLDSTLVENDRPALLHHKRVARRGPLATPNLIMGEHLRFSPMGPLRHLSPVQVTACSSTPKRASGRRPVGMVRDAPAQPPLALVGAPAGRCHHATPGLADESVPPRTAANLKREPPDDKRRAYGAPERCRRGGPWGRTGGAPPR